MKSLSQFFLFLKIFSAKFFKMPIPFLTRLIRRYEGRKGRGIERFVYSRFYYHIFKKIVPFIQKKDRILDVGSGSCYLANLFHQQGYKIDPVDVDDLSVYSQIKPRIYDGKRLPFGENEYDVGLLINVLHHCDEPERVFFETLRTCHRVIVHEDSPKYFWEWPFLQLFDMVGNFEFRYHRHRSPFWWRSFLKKNQLKVIHFENYTCWRNLFFLFGRYSWFVAEKG